LNLAKARQNPVFSRDFFMPNQNKIDQVEAVANNLKSAKSAALVQYQGLNADQIATLRSDIKKTGGHLEVVKNTLITLALEKLGLKLPQKLTEPTAIAYCQEDEIAPLKEIDKVNKASELTSFKYGFFDQKIISLEELKTLLILPGKSTLIAQLVGGLKNPLVRLSRTLNYHQTRLVMTLKAISEKDQSAKA